MGVATIRTAEDTLSVPRSESQPRVRLRLAVRVFLALALLLAVTIVATSATLLYNAAATLQDEAEANALNLSELFSASFAEMGEISVANVARTLDATLDPQMIAQARIAAHLTAAAEAAGWNPPRIIRMLEGIVGETVLDEFWITDETAFSYLTNVRDDRGRLVPFTFSFDPAVQPQASKFYVLLDGIDDDDVITQPAQVREIDNQVYKYVGVGGVDQERIVQVGNNIVFSDQEILTSRYTSERADVSAIIEGILGQQMAAQAIMLERFITAAEAAEWARDDIEFRLRRLATETVIGEIRVAGANNIPLYSSLLPPAAGGPEAALVRPGDLDELTGESGGVVEHPTAPRPSDGALYKYVTVATGDAGRRVQVGIPIESASGGNLLYSVYQREADVLVRSGNQNIDTIWIVNQDRELAAAARAAGPAIRADDRGRESRGSSSRSGAAAVMVQTAMDRSARRPAPGQSESRSRPEDARHRRGRLADHQHRRHSPSARLAIEVGLDEIAGHRASAKGVNTDGRRIPAARALTGGGAAVGLAQAHPGPSRTIADGARSRWKTGTQPESTRRWRWCIRRGDEIGQPCTRVFRHDRAGLQPRGSSSRSSSPRGRRSCEASNQRNCSLAYEAMEQDLSKWRRSCRPPLSSEGDTNVR